MSYYPSIVKDRKSSRSLSPGRGRGRSLSRGSSPKPDPSAPSRSSRIHPRTYSTAIEEAGARLQITAVDPTDPTSDFSAVLSQDYDQSSVGQPHPAQERRRRLEVTPGIEYRSQYRSFLQAIPQDVRPPANTPARSRQRILKGGRSGPHTDLPAISPNFLASTSLLSPSNASMRSQIVRPGRGSGVTVIQELVLNSSRQLPPPRSERCEGQLNMRGGTSSDLTAKRQQQPTAASGSEHNPAGLFKAQVVGSRIGNKALKSGVDVQDESIARTSQQFYPKSGHDRTIVPKPRQSPRIRDPTDKIGIGIETEFLLRALEPENRAASMCKFADIVAANYNNRIPSQHPRMYETVRSFPPKKVITDKWALTKDATIERHREPCKPPAFQLLWKVSTHVVANRNTQGGWKWHRLFW